MRVNELFERLAVRMNATETLARAVLKRLEQSAVPMEYKHVEGRFIRRMEVQYRNVGRLPPREVPFEDIDE